MEKNLFSVETCEDDSGMVVKAHGHQAPVVMMIAIGLVKYFDENDGALSMEDFIPVLRKAYEDREFFEKMVQAESLYAKNEDAGLLGFAALVAVANIERFMDENKNENERYS